MTVQLLLELVAGTVALVCFAIAAKAFVELFRMNRAAKRKAVLEAIPPRAEAEQSTRRAG